MRTLRAFRAKPFDIAELALAARSQSELSPAMLHALHDVSVYE